MGDGGNSSKGSTGLAGIRAICGAAFVVLCWQRFCHSFVKACNMVSCWFVLRVVCWAAYGFMETVTRLKLRSLNRLRRVWSSGFVALGFGLKA